MNIDFQASSMTFEMLKPGALFLFDVDGNAEIAIRIATTPSFQFGAACVTKSPVEGHRLPALVTDNALKGRSVLLLETAVIRPSLELTNVKIEAAPYRIGGAIIVSGTELFLRCCRAQDRYDLNLKSGVASQPTAYPGESWIETWSVIIPEPGRDVELLSFRAS